MLRLLAPVLGLFHRDFIDVRQCSGPRCSFDRANCDLLHLFLRVVHLLLHVSHLRVLPRHGFRQRFDLQLRDAPVGFGFLS